MNEWRYVAVQSRADDVINVAGHRLSCGAVEEAVMKHEDVVECAVIGVDDALKGSVPLGLCIIRNNAEASVEDISADIVSLVRGEIGPVAAFKQVLMVARLPKTRSGKIARHTIADLANNKPYKIPVTIEDASVVPELEEALKTIGYAINSPGPVV